MLDPIAHNVAFTHRLGHDVLERPIGCDGNGGCERAPERTLRVVCGVKQTARLISLSNRVCDELIEHFKPGRDIALERELVQQSRAKSVDGLHLEPAGGLQG